MRRAQLPITALPAWAKLNDVDFLDTCCIDLGGSKGFGIATSRALSSEDVVDLPTLLIVPQDLILSTDSIEEHLKVDQHFRQLVDLAGGTSLRDNVMLFLLMQITIVSPEHTQNVGLSNSWTHYIQMLPASVPVPTLWAEEEIYMLTGTSLEVCCQKFDVAVNAKMAKLQKEFDELHEKTAAISWCAKCWWESDRLKLSDWVLLDAWYRSRSLELPNSGEAMVPCLDMANHSSNSVAYWEQIESNKVALLLRPGLHLEKGAEITISYGSDKSAAEFLFSYGFIDETSSNASLILALQPFPDDPLGKAKVQAFTSTPAVKISKQGDVVVWESPFLYFMCLNEEDGLEFRVLQQVDGLRSPLRVFWQERDVTEETDKFEDMIDDHALKEVFHLRVLALLHDRIRQQLEGLYESEDMVNSIAMLAEPSRQESVMLLRNLETGVLEEAFETVEMRKQELLQNETVRRYLGSMEDNVNEAQLEEEENEANDEEDFS